MVFRAFTARYPSCQLELTLGAATQGLADGRIDLAIRVGWLPDSSLLARRIGTFLQVLVAGQRLPGQIASVRQPKDLAVTAGVGLGMAAIPSRLRGTCQS